MTAPDTHHVRGAPPPSSRPIRFVALGDSLTEGIGDPVGPGLRGWAALLADSLTPPHETPPTRASGTLTASEPPAPGPPALRPPASGPAALGAPASATLLPRPTPPGQTVPGASAPRETVPGATAPGAPAPGAPVPGGTLRGAPVLGAPTPGETLPGPTPPGETVPGVPVPEAAAPAAAEHHHPGWAAPVPRPVEFRNLAVSGALTRDVAVHQLPRALAYRPDLAAVVVGVNDTLRSSFDIGRIATDLDRVLGRLSRQGAVLLTACLPDPGRMLRLPAPLARPLARRQRAVNAVVHALSARHDAIHLHMADAAWVADRALWSADRLHPGERGHRLIAAGFHSLLAVRGLAHGPVPTHEPDQPPPTRAKTLRWLATAGTAWGVRRCHDLLPQLLRLAGTETAHWARGTLARLDAHAERQLTDALAGLATPAVPATRPAALLAPVLPAQRGRMEE